MSAALPIIFALYPLCLSGLALVWLLRVKGQSRSSWFVQASTCGSIIAFAFLAGPWAFTSYYLRYVLLGLFALAFMYSYRRVKLNEAITTARSAARPAFSVLILLMFTALDVLATASHYQPGEFLNLAFPLTSGTYYVLQGGNSVVTNPFHALSGNKMALDIVELTPLGNRARGIAPRTLDAYEIFGEKINCPCEGTVLAVRDGLPDNPPGRPDAEHPEGNYVVLKCADAEVFMAHMMQGSVVVAPGEIVRAKQLLGRVGNSGNTLEPHLHIAARKAETEMALRFNGRFLSLNNVVIIDERTPNSALQKLTFLAQIIVQPH